MITPKRRQPRGALASGGPRRPVCYNLSLPNVPSADLEMLTLITTAVVLLLLVLGFRWLRKREVAAFMDSDLSSMETVLLGNEAVMERGSLRREGSGTDAQRTDLPAASLPDAAPAATYNLVGRTRLFDEVTRSFLTALDPLLDERHRVFLNVPVSDLVRAGDAGAPSTQAPGWRVTIVISGREQFEFKCAVQLVDGSEKSRRELSELKELFGRIGWPLLSFPMTTDYSPPELREQFRELLD